MVVSGEMNLLCVLIQDPLFFFFFWFEADLGKKEESNTSRLCWMPSPLCGCPVFLKPVKVHWHTVVLSVNLHGCILGLESRRAPPAAPAAPNNRPMRFKDSARSLHCHIHFGCIVSSCQKVHLSCSLCCFHDNADTFRRQENESTD